MERNRSDAPGREALEGTVRVFAAESLVVPTGLVTVAFLTRWLGAGDYGVFSLAALIVGWVEWGTASLFARATILSVRGTGDWKPLATRILQLHFAAGLAVGALLFLAAPFVARTLSLPSLSGHLRLFALDVPLFLLAQGHRNIATGRGRFGHRARVVAARWIARMILILILVGLGLSVRGAIVASIGATVLELVVAQRYDRAPFFAWPAISSRGFLSASIPLVIAAMALKILQDADLFALKALGASSAEAGIFAGARNLAVVTNVFAAAFSPLILATLVRLVHSGDVDHARDMGKDALRLMLLLLPFAALVAGASDGIVRLILGSDFSAAGPLLSRLVFGGLGAAIMVVGGGILVAGGELDRSAWITGALVPITVAGHVWAIPRFGGLGAAWVTTGAMTAGAMATVVAVARMWGVRPPAATVARVALVSIAAGFGARAWPALGLWVVVQLGLFACAIPLALLALGEFSRREIDLARRAVFPDRDEEPA